MDVQNPQHYKYHSSGIECIHISRTLGFMYGNIFKYLYRYRYKNGVEDLKKALWYLRKAYVAEQPKESSAVLWATYDLLNDIIKSEPDRLAKALFTSFRALVFYGDANLFSVLPEIISILEEENDEETETE